MVIYTRRKQHIPALLVGKAATGDRKTRSWIVCLYIDDEGKLTLRHLKSVRNKCIMTLEEYYQMRNDEADGKE